MAEKEIKVRDFERRIDIVDVAIEWKVPESEKETKIRTEAKKFLREELPNLDETQQQTLVRKVEEYLARIDVEIENLDERFAVIAETVRAGTREKLHEETEKRFERFHDADTPKVYEVILKDTAEPHYMVLGGGNDARNKAAQEFAKEHDVDVYVYRRGWWSDAICSPSGELDLLSNGDPRDIDASDIAMIYDEIRLNAKTSGAPAESSEMREWDTETIRSAIERQIDTIDPIVHSWHEADRAAAQREIRTAIKEFVIEKQSEWSQAEIIECIDLVGDFTEKYVVRGEPWDWREDNLRIDIILEKIEEEVWKDKNFLTKDRSTQERQRLFAELNRSQLTDAERATREIMWDFFEEGDSGYRFDIACAQMKRASTPSVPAETRLDERTWSRFAGVFENRVSYPDHFRNIETLMELVRLVNQSGQIDERFIDEAEVTKLYTEFDGEEYDKEKFKQALTKILDQLLEKMETIAEKLEKFFDEEGKDAESEWEADGDGGGDGEEEDDDEKDGEREGAEAEKTMSEKSREFYDENAQWFEAYFAALQRYSNQDKSIAKDWRAVNVGAVVSAFQKVKDENYSEASVKDFQNILKLTKFASDLTIDGQLWPQTLKAFKAVAEGVIGKSITIETQFPRPSGWTVVAGVAPSVAWYDDAARTERERKRMAPHEGPYIYVRDGVYRIVGEDGEERIVDMDSLSSTFIEVIGDLRQEIELFELALGAFLSRSDTYADIHEKFITLLQGYDSTAGDAEQKLRDKILKLAKEVDTIYDDNTTTIWDPESLEKILRDQSGVDERFAVYDLIRWISPDHLREHLRSLTYEEVTGMTRNMMEQIGIQYLQAWSVDDFKAKIESAGAWTPLAKLKEFLQEHDMYYAFIGKLRQAEAGLDETFDQKWQENAAEWKKQMEADNKEREANELAKLNEDAYKDIRRRQARYVHIRQVITGSIFEYAFADLYENTLGKEGETYSGKYEKELQLYAGMEGYGFWDFSDENANLLKEQAVMFALTLPLGLVGGVGVWILATRVGMGIGRTIGLVSTGSRIARYGRYARTLGAGAASGIGGYEGMLAGQMIAESMLYEDAEISWDRFMESQEWEMLVASGLLASALPVISQAVGRAVAHRTGNKLLAGSTEALTIAVGGGVTMTAVNAHIKYGDFTDMPMDELALNIASGVAMAFVLAAASRWSAAGGRGASRETGAPRDRDIIIGRVGWRVRASFGRKPGTPTFAEESAVFSRGFERVRQSGSRDFQHREGGKIRITRTSPESQPGIYKIRHWTRAGRIENIGDDIAQADLFSTVKPLMNQRALSSISRAALRQRVTTYFDNKIEGTGNVGRTRTHERVQIKKVADDNYQVRFRGDSADDTWITVASRADAERLVANMNTAARELSGMYGLGSRTMRRQLARFANDPSQDEFEILGTNMKVQKNGNNFNLVDENGNIVNGVQNRTLAQLGDDLAAYAPEHDAAVMRTAFQRWAQRVASAPAAAPGAAAGASAWGFWNSMKSAIRWSRRAAWSVAHTGTTSRQSILAWLDKNPGWISQNTPIGYYRGLANALINKEGLGKLAALQRTFLTGAYGWTGTLGAGAVAGVVTGVEQWLEPASDDTSPEYRFLENYASTVFLGVGTALLVKHLPEIVNYWQELWDDEPNWWDTAQWIVDNLVWSGQEFVLEIWGMKSEDVL